MGTMSAAALLLGRALRASSGGPSAASFSPAASRSALHAASPPAMIGDDERQGAPPCCAPAACSTSAPAASALGGGGGGGAPTRRRRTIGSPLRRAGAWGGASSSPPSHRAFSASPTSSAAAAAAGAAAAAAAAAAAPAPAPGYPLILDGKRVAAAWMAELELRVADVTSRIGRRPGLAVILVGAPCVDWRGGRRAAEWSSPLAACRLHALLLPSLSPPPPLTAHRHSAPPPPLLAAAAAARAGDRADSLLYVNRKREACQRVGVAAEVHRLPGDVTGGALLAAVRAVCADPAVDGVLIQLPLPRHLDEEAVLEALDPRKDVDGFHPLSAPPLVVDPPSPPPQKLLAALAMLASLALPLGRPAALLDIAFSHRTLH